MNYRSLERDIRPAGGPGAPGRRSAARLAGAWGVAGAVLFLVYLRLSATYAENSDMANVLLMGSDLLHGNLLLGGWHTSDVSFYPTELIQYALLESFLGLRMATAHAAAAMTYTLVVLLAAALARGGPGTPPGERAFRPLLAGGLLLAPQLGTGVYAVDVAVGHIGTAVPLLMIWLLLDRTRFRWWLPPLVAVLLAWVLVADPIAQITGVAPLLLVAGGRFLCQRLAPAAPTGPGDAPGGAGPRGGAGPGGAADAALAVAAAAGYGLSLAAEALLRGLGGYALSPLPVQMRGLSQLGGIASALWKVLVLFGADFNGLHGIRLLLALLHLASVVLVLAGCAVTARNARYRANMVDQILLVGIAANLTLYLATLASTQGAHEIAIVAAYAAALTARTLAGPLLAAWAEARRTTLLAKALTGGMAALVSGGYVAGLGYELTAPPSPSQNQPLASWLEQHHFTSGLGGYWQSSSVTVETGGRVRVRALLAGTVKPYLWMADTAWYDPARSTASFVITQAPTRQYLARLAAAFGPADGSYRVDGYTILVWNAKNLLRDLAP